MINLTENLKFKIPDPSTENVSPAPFSENWTVLDNYLAQIKEQNEFKLLKTIEINTEESAEIPIEEVDFSAFRELLISFEGTVTVTKGVIQMGIGSLLSASEKDTSILYIGTPGTTFLSNEPFVQRFERPGSFHSNSGAKKFISIDGKWVNPDYGAISVIFGTSSSSGKGSVSGNLKIYGKQVISETLIWK